MNEGSPADSGDIQDLFARASRLLEQLWNWAEHHDEDALSPELIEQSKTTVTLLLAKIRERVPRKSFLSDVASDCAMPVREWLRRAMKDEHVAARLLLRYDYDRFSEVLQCLRASWDAYDVLVDAYKCLDHAVSQCQQVATDRLEYDAPLPLPKFELDIDPPQAVSVNGIVIKLGRDTHARRVFELMANAFSCWCSDRQILAAMYDGIPASLGALRNDVRNSLLGHRRKVIHVIKQRLCESGADRVVEIRRKQEGMRSFYAFGHAANAANRHSPQK